MTANGHYGTKRHLKYFASRLSFLSQLLGFETSVLVAVESKAEFTPCQCFSFVRFGLSSEVDQAFSKPAGTEYQSVYINHALCVSDTLLFMPSDDPVRLS